MHSRQFASISGFKADWFDAASGPGDDWASGCLRQELEVGGWWMVWEKVIYFRLLSSTDLLARFAVMICGQVFLCSSLFRILYSVLELQVFFVILPLEGTVLLCVRYVPKTRCDDLTCQFIWLGLGLGLLSQVLPPPCQGGGLLVSIGMLRYEGLT